MSEVPLQAPRRDRSPTPSCPPPPRRCVRRTCNGPPVQAPPTALAGGSIPPLSARAARQRSGLPVAALHVDGAVQDAGPLVGVERGVVVVADVAHGAEVVADDERHGRAERVEHRLAAGGQRPRLDLVKSSGFRVQGPGFRVQGAGFGVQGSGCRVQGSGFRVQGAGLRVEG